MEVMKQLRQRAIRDLVEQRPIRTQQELAGALRERGFRTTQATISRDVAELGLIKAATGRDRGVRAAAAPHRGRDLGRGPAAQAPRGPARWRSTTPACCSSCARCRGRPMPSRPPWTGLAGPRSAAPSPATTRCSWRSRTEGRCSASSGGSCASPEAPLTTVRRRPLTPRGVRDYHSRPVELQARGTTRGSLEFFPYQLTARGGHAHFRPPAPRGPSA